MLMTFDVPTELAVRLYPFARELPQLLELGLHEFTQPKQQGFNGINDILEFLASVPTPDEIIALRPSEVLQTQANELLEKQRHGTLSTAEQQQWQQYEYVEHLVRTAKANAFLKLQAAA
jgi:hypothetical protein